MIAVCLLWLACKGGDEHAAYRARPPWGSLSEHLAAAQGGKVPGVEQLRKRARQSKRFRPYPVPTATAKRRAERLLRDLAKPGHSLDLLEPPVDWGAQSGHRSAHFRRNSLRAVRPLLEAHIATHDQRYLDPLRRVVLDWIDYNLVENRKNEAMWHDMETGLRAVVLAYVLEQELLQSESDDEVLDKLVWAAERHAEILHDPRLFSEGRHGIYMMLGLEALVSVLPELKGAKQLTSYADSKMAHLLATSFSKEGFHLEHSPEYHMVATNAVQGILDMHLFDNVRGISELLSKARGVTYQLFHPRGDRVMIGDSSRGSIPLRGEAKQHHRFIASEGKRGKRPPAGLLAHPDVGYVFYRSSFDEKPFTDHSFLFFASGFHSQHHKHADHLSFEWSDLGHPILVNSGKYEYSRGRWREFFVSTRAGNAVEVDGEDYSTRAKPWGGGLSGWGTLGELQFMQADVHPVIEHGRKQTLQVEQVRTLVLLPHQWLCVVDQVSVPLATGSPANEKDPPPRLHVFRQWLHFHEDYEVTEQEGGFVATLAKGPTVHVQTLARPAPKLELAVGQTEPRIQGWLSAEYLEKTKRASIAFRVEGEDALFVTLLSLVGKVHAPAVQQDDQGVEISFTTRTRQHFAVMPGQVTLD